MLVDNFKLAGASEGTARDVANAVVNEIIQDRKRKNIDLEKNWEMYQGHHTQYFKQRINEDNAIFEYRKKNAVTVNYVDFTIDLSARYLYGRASKILRKYSENAQTQKRMTELARKVELDTFCLNASKKAATFGKQTARLVPVDALTGLQPVGRTTKTCYPKQLGQDNCRSR
jgi:predicted MarR family transcription regulator